VLAAGFLVAAPLLAPVTGSMAHADAMREVRQDTSWRQVSAVLLRSAPQQYYGYGAMTTFWVPARWTAPDGAVRTAEVQARNGAAAGSTVQVWVNRAGRLTGRQPMTTGLVRVRTALVEFLTVIALGLLAATLAVLLRIGMNRRRMRYWAVEWACFGPRWTSKRWPRH